MNMKYYNFEVNICFPTTQFEHRNTDGTIVLLRFKGMTDHVMLVYYGFKCFLNYNNNSAIFKQNNF